MSASDSEKKFYLGANFTKDPEQGAGRREKDLSNNTEEKDVKEMCRVSERFKCKGGERDNKRREEKVVYIGV